MRANIETSKAVAGKGKVSNIIKYQEGNGYLNDRRLESFGHVLDDYVLQGAALTIDTINPQLIHIGEGIISFSDQLWRSFYSDFTVTLPNTTYYIGFLIETGYIFGVTEPTENYMKLWSVQTDVNGIPGAITDFRGELNRLKFKAIYDGVYLNTEEVNRAVASVTGAVANAEKAVIEAEQAVLNATNAILGANKASDDSRKATADSVIATQNAVNVVNEVNLIKLVVEQALLDAETLKQNLEKTSDDAKLVIQQTTTAKNEVIIISEQMEQEILNVQTKLENLVHKGDYSNTVTYQVGNEVTLGGSSFVAIKQNIGNPPLMNGLVDTVNWAVRSRKGLDGSGSVSSVNGVQPDANGNVQLVFVNNWTDLAGKPTTFPPSAHSHKHSELLTGRNYILGTSGILTNKNDYLTVNTLSKDYLELAGKEVTISFEVRFAPGVAAQEITFHTVDLSERIQVNETWKPHAFTFVTTAAQNEYVEFSQIDVEVRNLKLELGNSPSAWVPAIEDAKPLVDKLLKTEADLSHELTSNRPVVVNIARGVQTVTVTKDTPVNVLNFKGKTVVNHAPLFDSGLWYSTDTIILNSPSKITFTGLSTKAVSYRLEIPLKPNTTYTFSCITNGYVSATIATDNTFAQHRVMINRLGGTFTFSTSATETIARFWLSNQDDLSVNYVGTFTFENVMLNEGATAQEFVANVKGITNPTIEVKGLNLVPPLSQWEPSSLPTFLRSVSENELVIESITRVDFATRGVYVSLLPNTEYVFSVELETSNFVTNDVGGYYNLIEHLKDGTTIDHSTPPFHTTNGKVTLSKKITTHTDTARVRLIVGGYSFTGKLAIRNAMLNVGPVARPFEPYQSDTLTYVGTFHEGDEVNGKTVNRTKKEILLDGSLPWIYSGAVSGFKELKINVNGMKHTSNYETEVTSIVAKYNGKILKHGYTGASGDSNYISDSNIFWVSVPNSDSGWGDNYTPTKDEIKAYFMGWRMYTWNGSANVDYNGTGVKQWSKVYCGVGTPVIVGTGGVVVQSTGTTVLPTTTNDMGYKPYRLIYDLAAPVTESVKTIGSLTLAKGDNVVEVTEGRIAREKVDIIFDSGTYQMNNTFSANPSNLFKHRAGTLLNVYKNGVIDINNWTYYPNGVTASKNGFVLTALPELYDNTAIYEVEYIPLEPYKVSTHTTPIEISYRDTLGGVVDELVNDVSDLEKRVLINESVVAQILKNDYAKKIQESWKTPVLQNGWTIFEGFDTVGFYKDEFNIVHLKGVLKGGTMNTAMFTLPVGYRPSGILLFPCVANTGSTDIVGRVQVDYAGQVYTPLGGNVLTSLNGISFKV